MKLTPIKPALRAVAFAMLFGGVCRSGSGLPGSRGMFQAASRKPFASAEGITVGISSWTPLGRNAV